MLDYGCLLQKYLKGEDVVLSQQEFEEATEGLSAFTRRVLKGATLIPRGKTLTYKELAEKIGSPKAVRAVASALGRNPLPILIPCHRVVAGNGIGGFAFGIELKKLLLEFESKNLFSLPT